MMKFKFLDLFRETKEEKIQNESEFMQLKYPSIWTNFSGKDFLLFVLENNSKYLLVKDCPNFYKYLIVGFFEKEVDAMYYRKIMLPPPKELEWDFMVFQCGKDIYNGDIKK